ncbi:MAG TPA: hypothetical protein VE982_06910 [Gaiellaceae bacterium]|nr:hypothetical protein [Gaiellaceae bacterium]
MPGSSCSSARVPGVEGAQPVGVEPPVERRLGDGVEPLDLLLGQPLRRLELEQPPRRGKGGELLAVEVELAPEALRDLAAHDGRLGCRPARRDHRPRRRLVRRVEERRPQPRVAPL